MLTSIEKKNQELCLIRVDASTKIGTGHLKRCMTLAHKMYEAGINIHFLCRETDIDIHAFFKNTPYTLELLPSAISSREISNPVSYQDWLDVSQEQDAIQVKEYILDLKTACGWLIVDHYAIDACWEKMLTEVVSKIIVIDDLANRQHDCDVLLDQNYYLNLNSRYQNLIPSRCETLLGPEYALLQDEYMLAKKNSQIRENVHNILINFGGVDASNQTLNALQAALRIENQTINIHVVVGQSHPYRDEIEKLCQSHSNCKFYCQLDTLAHLINQVDLAIGAGGVSLWERMALGCPSIVCCIADNQRQILEDINQLGCIDYLGDHQNVDILAYYQSILKLLNDPKRLEILSKKSFKIVDGLGTSRVLKTLTKANSI